MQYFNTNLQNKSDNLFWLFIQYLSCIFGHQSYVIVTAKQQPQPQQQNNHNCSWVETKESLGTPQQPPQELETT